MLRLLWALYHATADNSVKQKISTMISQDGISASPKPLSLRLYPDCVISALYGHSSPFGANWELLPSISHYATFLLDMDCWQDGTRNSFTFQREKRIISAGFQVLSWWEKCRVCRICAGEYPGRSRNIREILKDPKRNRKENEDAQARGT